MKKILFLINTLSGGGAEKVLVDTVNNLNDKIYDITVQTVYDCGVFKNRLSDKIKYKSIIRFKNKILRKMVSKILFSVFGARFVYNNFIRADYDYEIAFLEGLPTKIISNSTSVNCQKYAWIHTDIEKYPDSFLVYGTEFNEMKAYERFDKIFCVSDSVRRSFNKKYGMSDSTITVYNILDDHSIIAASNEPVVLPLCPKPLFVSVGRLIAQKGYERLLNVHKRLIHEGYEHSLIIIGDGEQRERLQANIRENNLSATAFLLGFQHNPYKYIKNCDLFICASLAEGFSTVVSEAVLCGVPVLSTNVAGADEPPDMPRCSLIVENSEDALYKGIKSVLEHPKIEMYRDELNKKQEILKKDYLISEFCRKVFGDEKTFYKTI